MVSARRRQTSPIKIWFDPEMNTELAQERARNACVIGETVDISKSGIGFIVPSIRVKEKYLVGQLRALNVEIDLPTGKISMRLIGRRYEKVGQHISTERFLIGAEILELRGADREAYESFLKRPAQRVPKTTGEVRVGI